METDNPTADTTAQLDIYATGLNAHAQLADNNDNSDVQAFTRITESSNAAARILFTGWSTTILLLDNHIQSLGNQVLSQDLEPGVASTLHNGFGDHNGMIGFLDTAGKLWLTSSEALECVSDAEGSPSLGYLALAGNGQVAITFKQAPNGRLCHILQFETVEEFLLWFQDPSQVKLEAERQHFMMQGRPKQVVAGAATFLVLMEDGEVYSWGDPRYHSLGRSVVGEGSTPAERPGIVDALGGLKIEKVAAGGWMGAALSEDRALYVWGTGTPGASRTIRPLRDAETGEVVLVEIFDAGESLDITDVGVGDDHVAVVVDEKQLFVIGDNTNGQLGLKTDDSFIDEWTKVPSERAIRHVVCGPKATFIFQKTD